MIYSVIVALKKIEVAFSSLLSFDSLLSCLKESGGEQDGHIIGVEVVKIFIDGIFQ